MKLIALKIDVDTSDAIEIGVPQLATLLRAHQAGATFFWSMGREKNGSLLRPARFIRKVAGFSTLPLRQRFAWSGILRGSLLPSRNLAKLAGEAIGSLADAEFEHGVRPAQRHLWQSGIMQMDGEQTRVAYQEATQFYQRITGQTPRCHAAFGWQINRTAFRLHQMNQLTFASDCRGQSPFWPIVQGEYTRCPQIPVTLPMLEELVASMPIEQAIAQLVGLTSFENTALHVFNIAADFDTQYLESLGQLLSAWQQQGYQLVSLGQVAQSLNLKQLPYHHVEMQACQGRWGAVATQAGVYP